MYTLTVNNTRYTRRFPYFVANGRAKNVTFWRLHVLYLFNTVQVRPWADSQAKSYADQFTPRKEHGNQRNFYETSTRFSSLIDELVTHMLIRC